MAVAPAGMEGVVAADSAITYIDGARGELRYRGYEIGELASSVGFEDVCYLLWHGELPDAGQRAELAARLAEERQRAGRLVRWLDDIPREAHPLDVLRFVLSREALDNPLAWDNGRDSNERKAVEMCGWFPVVVAAYHRLRRSQEPIRPPEYQETARSFLAMLGTTATDRAVRALDAFFVLHADHELNASTFAARVTIATQSNLHAAVSSALGTLAGPRHGGASDRVIQMLEEIGTPERAEAWVREELAARRRVMGFGHRVYRVADPRSHHLRAMAEELLAGGPQSSWIEILERISAVMASERSLYPNVDLWAALVEHELGIEPDFYTSVFACSRIVGWTAHAIEQLDGRMIRPIARYTGPGPRRVPSKLFA